LNALQPETDNTMDERGRNDRDRDVVLSARGVTVAFGRKVVLDKLDLDIYRGEILGFVGASGAGKSVLMRTVLRLLPRQGGTIKILGEDYDSLDEPARNKLDMRLGVLFQQGALFSSLTVKENIPVPMREYLDLPVALMDELAHLKIRMVGLAADAADKYPSELSGGMIKRAALARALALDPDLVFLDEPTSGLDPIGAAECGTRLVSPSIWSRTTSTACFRFATALPCSGRNAYWWKGRSTTCLSATSPG